MELSINDLKALLENVNASAPASPASNEQAFKKGDRVLVRAHMVGTQVGTVDSHVIGGKLNFSESRKLWRWGVKDGIALESLAISGVDPKRTRATAIVPESINDSDCCGIMPLSEEIYRQIMSLEVSEQD